MELNFFLAILAAVFRHSEGYAILNSVSWAVSNDVEGELEANSNEEAAPALLVDAGSIWKQAFPASVYDNDAEKPPEPLLQTKDLKEASAAPRMFSYRMDGMKRAAGAPPPPEETAKAARYMAHYSDWGFLATISTLDTIKGVPFGKVFPVSDGPSDNSTGVPYFYVSEMDNTVTDLRSNPLASLTFADVQGICREKGRDVADPRCARLTLTGQVMDVGKEELEFAKQALFSRHPGMRAWPGEHRWLFLKLRLGSVWLQDWMGRVSLVPLQEYLTATPH
ncbi:hypothetical protein COCON_G00200980 [Conger conger]|uniref:CREG-like beta-barrel domain-containing protein n=1 Tax=Conger conger TaxID=82655 RepID=A0A9Q1HR95_CONCO|nr:protein CREG2 [Conger conger]KAJ8256234.1 hypothetical protein COCON_G00200980 [Conger conger]